VLLICVGAIGVVVGVVVVTMYFCQKKKREGLDKRLVEEPGLGDEERSEVKGVERQSDGRVKNPGSVL
jgi:hypothetical protein